MIVDLVLINWLVYLMIYLFFFSVVGCIVMQYVLKTILSMTSMCVFGSVNFLLPFR